MDIGLLQHLSELGSNPRLTTQGKMRPMVRCGPRMPRGGGMAGGGGFRGKRFLLRPPFDLYVCEDAFQRVRANSDDSTSQQMLFKRNAGLSPTPQEQSAILNLVTVVGDVLDSLIVAPQNFDACQLEEHRQVGSFKKGTMRTGRNVADIVAILKTLPTREAVEALANKTYDLLEQRGSVDSSSVTMLSEGRGFDLTRDFDGGVTATVRVLVTTIHQNLRKLDPELHINVHHLRSHLAAIRHSRWFEENAHHSSIKMLIRLLRFLCDSFPGLQALNPWLLDLLVHYSVLNTPSRQPLPVHVAFRRCIQLLAAGIFLPGSAGIVDPCESGGVRAHLCLSLGQQDLVCSTAQNVLRVLAHGGLRHVIGLEPASGAISELSVWDGVVVSPLKPAYEDQSTGTTALSDQVSGSGRCSDVDKCDLDMEVTGAEVAAVN